MIEGIADLPGISTVLGPLSDKIIAAGEHDGAAEMLAELRPFTAETFTAEPLRLSMDDFAKLPAAMSTAAQELVTDELPKIGIDPAGIMAVSFMHGMVFSVEAIAARPLPDIGG